MGHIQSPLVVALLTVVTVLGVLGFFLLFKHLFSKKKIAYTSVNHGLDDEEMAFKQAMEAQGDDIDEMFNFTGDDELEFDSNDLDNLEMLATYRDNLAASVESSMVETGLGKDDFIGERQTNGGRTPIAGNTEED
ncbi:unnamed protein product [Choristocarpus tenellus]